MAKTNSCAVVDVHGKACMLYGALGDAIGYKNGAWEFELDGKEILKQVQQMGGIDKIWVNEEEWPVSDDTIMHLATCVALWQTLHPDAVVRSKLKSLSMEKNVEFETLLSQAASIVSEYKLKTLIIVSVDNAIRSDFEKAIIRWYTRCISAMDGRAPGRQTLDAVAKYLEHGKMPNQLSSIAGGNGAAMRCMCIGLVTSSVDTIVELAGIASVATHPNVTGVLGGIMSAAFTSMAMQNIHPIHWPFLFFERYYGPSIEWIKRRFNLSAINDTYFCDQWYRYLGARFTTSEKGAKKAKFSKTWLGDLVERQDFFGQFAFKNSAGHSWNGSSGHDSVMIAYDSLLYLPADWHTVLFLSAIHGGDSDSTASIAGAFFGAYIGMKNPTMEGLEFQDNIVSLASYLPYLVAK